MRAPVFGLLIAAGSSAFSQTTFTEGNVRIQVLSPTLLRIEQKGPKGFEDRNTFHVVGRQGWPGAKLHKVSNDEVVALEVGKWEVDIPRIPRSIKEVSVLGIGPGNKRHEIYAFDGKLVNSAWIPAPGHVPEAWAIADSPRMAPSQAGLTPFGNDPASGWDLANDAPDIYVFLPKGSYQQLRKDFLKLTGPVEMPPLYALGYTDSRYYAYHQDEALARIDEYRRRHIPLDTFVVDTDWRIGGSHGYSVDPKYFPNMPAFLRAAHEKHAHIMFNDHPEPQATTALDPKELQYRLDGLGGLMNEGVDIWWYDRNWGVSLINPAPGLRHEVWGMKLYHDVAQRVRPNQRPLIMSNVDGIDNGFRNRPPEIVTHRYPVQWTGDTRSQWEFLRRGVENAVFEGVEGLSPWVNEDLGGHVGKPAPDLYVRYLQFGSVCPFMRVHCTKGQTREPWAFGPDAERIVPEYINMRYRLMPLFYASARAAYDRGEPLLRRLDLLYPSLKGASANDQFLIGDSLLVAPIVGGHDAAIVPASAFPSGLRADYYDNKNLQGNPVLSRVEAALNLDWGGGSPGSQVPNDNFSARFAGKVTIPSDHIYRLSITGDDGVRLWIDGKLLVDKWEAQDSVTTEAAMDLKPGSTHDIKVEYMELSGDASVRLRWQPVTPAATTAQRSVWIPPGMWVNVWTGAIESGPRTIAVAAPLAQMPMFMSAGAIIPIGPEVQWTGQRDWSALALDLMPGNGTFSLYEDDGSTLGYTRGEFRRTPIWMSRRGGLCEISIGPATGSYAGAVRTRAWTLRIYGTEPNYVTVDGRASRSVAVPRAPNQPFRASGGEPTGSIVEIKIPASSVKKKHLVIVSF